MLDLPCQGGGGVNPTSMAQNDTHVALIILTTQMWGGGGLLMEKTFSGQICVPAPLAPTSVLTQNKGPDTEFHFSNPPPPPSFGGRPCHPPPRRANFRSPFGMPYPCCLSWPQLRPTTQLLRLACTPWPPTSKSKKSPRVLEAPSPPHVTTPGVPGAKGQIHTILPNTSASTVTR